MCTQELIWCSCGHGEFLAIQTCSRALLTGFCWTVVHGNHLCVVPSRCSYCKAGFQARRPLPSVWPRARERERAAQVETSGKAEVELEDSGAVGKGGGLDGAGSGSAGKWWVDLDGFAGLEDEGVDVGKTGREVGDVLDGTEWTEGFDLSAEFGDGGDLWQYGGGGGIG